MRRPRLASAVSAAAFLVACSSAPPPPSATQVSTTPLPSAALTCAADTADCDGNPETRCETHLDTSAQHCGACGTACTGGEACVSGLCRRATVLSAGDDRACAVVKGGAVRCWGAETRLVRAEGQPSYQLTPTEVPGVEGAVAVRTGTNGSCAVLASGKVKGWGGLFFSTVLEMRGVDDAIDAALHHNDLFAVKRTGEVVYGTFGETEEGIAEADAGLKTIAGLRDATSIAVGSDHRCALRRSGEVVCWGDAAATGGGELEEGAEDGRGDDSDDEKPRLTKVKGLTNAVQISTTGDFTCAVTKNGQVVCWGDNYAGKLGAGEADAQSEPVTVKGLTDAVEVAAGMMHACALRRTGEISCWGSNFEGELGNGAIGQGMEPASVKGLTDAISITAGEGFSCARRKVGGAVCWGNAGHGRLGNGTTSIHPTPYEVEGVAGARAVSAVDHFTCALGQSGSVTCFGLGAPDYEEIRARGRGFSPRVIPGLSDAVDLRASDSYACATRKSGDVTCWLNEMPQPGNDTRGEEAWRPFPIHGLGSVETVLGDFSVGYALSRSKQLVLWDGGAMYASRRAQTNAEPPQKITLAGIRDAVSFATTGNVVCVARKSGKVSCSAINKYKLFDRKKPVKPGALVEIPGISDATGIDAGSRDFCITRKTGEVGCFSSLPLVEAAKPAADANDAKDKKDKKPTAVKPIEVKPSKGIAGAVKVSVGDRSHCALLTSGRVACFGDNSEGQLGLEDLDRHTVAAPVVGLFDAVDVSVAPSHACAALKNGRLMCWGSNKSDQAGHPDEANVTRPVAVKGLDF